MFRESVRTFDLYDFFSVIVPGLVFLLVVLPLFPQTIPIKFGITGLILVVVFGVAIGRAVHIIGTLLEDFSSVKSHREQFSNKLQNPDKRIQELFVDEVKSLWGIDIKDSDVDLEDVYILVRSRIHMAGTGRSRTFQAINDFFRSMIVICASMLVLYFVYTIYLLIGGGYKAYIHTFLREGSCFGVALPNGYSICEQPLHPSIIFFASGVIFSAGYWIFSRAWQDFREIYLDYLIADFINHRQNDKPREHPKYILERVENTEISEDQETEEADKEKPT